MNLKAMAAVLFLAASLPSGTTQAQIYNTTFTSGTSFTPVFSQGSFTATFAGPNLSYYSETDPSVRNISAGTLSLLFNQPVVAISFDVGGLDTSWGDQITFPIVPLTPLQLAFNRSVPFQNLATLSGATLLPLDSGYGARVTFGNLGSGGGITTFLWNDTGTAGSNDWTFYDNFTFTVVPEPAATVFIALGAAAWFVRRAHR